MDIPEPKDHPWIFAIIVAVVAGMGQLLASKEQLTWRIVVGRALSSGAFGVAAGVVFLWYPKADPMVMLGIAAVIASLGTSGLERIIQIIAGRR